MEDLTCGEPVPGGCARRAREVVLAISSIDMAGPMRQWAVHLRCGDGHSADRTADAIRTADPGATVLAFTTQQVLEPGTFAAMLARRYPAEMS